MTGSLPAVRIERSGRWRDAGGRYRPVDVIALPYDWHHDAARDRPLADVPAEPTPLGPDGVLHYARFRDAGRTDGPTWVETPGRPTVDEAVADAAARASSPIEWGVVAPRPEPGRWWFEGRRQPWTFGRAFVWAWTVLLVGLGVWGLVDDDPSQRPVNVVMPILLIALVWFAYRRGAVMRARSSRGSR